MSQARSGVNPEVRPSGTGCVECMAANQWWVHLRRCAECGHIGCCDTSPNRHATAHFQATAHPIIASFEPGEDWAFDYGTQEFIEHAPRLAPPHSHPVDQPVPGPRGRVPADWQSKIH